MLFHFQPCVVSSATMMTCQTPDLTPGLDIAEYDINLDIILQQESSASHRQRREAAADDPSTPTGGADDTSLPINNADLSFFVSFKLDGVPGSEDFQSIPVYKYPRFHRFSEPNHIRKYKNTDREIQIKVGLKRWVKCS